MHSLNNVVTQAAVDTSVPRRKTTGSDEKTEQSLSCLNRIVEQIKKLIAALLCDSSQEENMMRIPGHWWASFFPRLVRGNGNFWSEITFVCCNCFTTPTLEIYFVLWMHAPSPCLIFRPQLWHLFAIQLCQVADVALALLSSWGDSAQFKSCWDEQTARIGLSFHPVSEPKAAVNADARGGVHICDTVATIDVVSDATFKVRALSQDIVMTNLLPFTVPTDSAYPSPRIGMARHTCELSAIVQL